MSKPRVRIILLCEDRNQEHFFRRICQRFDNPVIRIQVAPKGQGSAEQWVRHRYPTEVQAYRRKKAELIGLIAVTDGDRFGVTERKLALDNSLAEAEMDRRQEDDRVATCVPTWSIETWFAWLCGLDEVDEVTSYKEHSGYKEAVRQGIASPSKAARHWFESDRSAEPPSSLADGRLEMARLKAVRE